VNDNNKGLPWKGIAIGAAVAAVFVLWFFLPLDEWMQALNEWIEGLGLLGYFVFGVIYIIATVILMPGSLLTLAAGLTFGLWAFPVVVIAATIGAAFAFLIGRYLARGAVEERFQNDPRFKAIDSAVSEEGWKIVGLLRLSPLVPFNLQNYLYGLTDIKLPHYVLATFFGIMPGSLLYVYFGAAGKAALDGGGEGGDPVLKWTLFAAGLIATLAVTVLVTKKAKAKLDQIGVEDELDTSV